MLKSAKEVAAKIAAVAAETGAKKVDVVGHSQGGIVSRIAINAYGSAALADRVVLLSSPYAATGLPIDITKIARAAIPRGLWDAVEQNGFVPIPYATFTNPWALQKAFALQPHVAYTEITDAADEVNMLGGMAAPPGAKNARTRYINDVCPTDFSQHFMQPYSATALAMIATALDPAHPVTGRCDIVPLYRG